MNVVDIAPERVSVAVQWQQAEGEEWDSGIRVIVNHFKEIKQVSEKTLRLIAVVHEVNTFRLYLYRYCK